MSRMFPNLFSAFELGPLALKNRIFVPGHATSLSVESRISDDLVAYHERRAAAGVGLIITEVNMVHASAVYSPKFLSAADDGCIPGLTRLAEAVRGHGCGLIGQLYHPGRSLRSSLDGSLLVAHAPSEVPDEVFHVTPRPFPLKLIREVIESYGLAAGRMNGGGSRWGRGRGQPRLSGEPVPETPASTCATTSSVAISSAGCASPAR